MLNEFYKYFVNFVRNGEDGEPSSPSVLTNSPSKLQTNEMNVISGKCLIVTSGIELRIK